MHYQLTRWRCESTKVNHLISTPSTQGERRQWQWSPTHMVPVGMCLSPWSKQEQLHLHYNSGSQHHWQSTVKNGQLIERRWGAKVCPNNCVRQNQFRLTSQAAARMKTLRPQRVTAAVKGAWSSKMTMRTLVHTMTSEPNWKQESRPYSSGMVARGLHTPATVLF